MFFFNPTRVLSKPKAILHLPTLKWSMMEQSQPCLNSSSRGGQKRTKRKDWAKSTLLAKLVSVFVLDLAFLPLLSNSRGNIIHINSLLPSVSWKTSAHSSHALYFPPSSIDAKGSGAFNIQNCWGFLYEPNCHLFQMLMSAEDHSRLKNCMKNFTLAKLHHFLYKGLMLNLIRKCWTTFHFHLHWHAPKTLLTSMELFCIYTGCKPCLNLSHCWSEYHNALTPESKRYRRERPCWWMMEWWQRCWMSPSIIAWEPQSSFLCKFSLFSPPLSLSMLSINSLALYHELEKSSHFISEREILKGGKYI